MIFSKERSGKLAGTLRNTVPHSPAEDICFRAACRTSAPWLPLTPGHSIILTVLLDSSKHIAAFKANVFTELLGSQGSFSMTLSKQNSPLLVFLISRLLCRCLPLLLSAVWHNLMWELWYLPPYDRNMLTYTPQKLQLTWQKNMSLSENQ